MLLVQTIVLVYQMAELVLDELCLIREIFDFPAHELAQAQVLVESRRGFIFTLENVAKARTKAHFAAPIEHDLRRS